MLTFQSLSLKHLSAPRETAFEKRAMADMSIAICMYGLWLVLASFEAPSDPSYNRYLEMKMLNALWKQAVMHLTISGTYQGQELLPHCAEFMFLYNTASMTRTFTPVELGAREGSRVAC